jgi:arylsulfatase A-like enzyme/thioredoxin-like negative regulator of GroEL
MVFIRHLVWVVVLASGAVAASAPPNIILITLDTVRADRMGFLGSKRGLTPNLDAVAGQSAVFTHAYSQVPITTPSHAVILTGTYPQFNQVTDFQVPLAPDLPYAPEILRSHGYHTAAFLASIVLDPGAKLAPGFDRGFDTYDAGFHVRFPGEDRYHSSERRGDVVIEHALAWLRQHPKGPFFVWVHLYDAHHPYRPPEPFRSRYAKTPYDGGIAYVDSVVGKFVRQLRARGLYDDSIVAIMADHGESLGAHGEDMHGIFLYDETIHVPLVFKLPGSKLPGSKPAEPQRVENRVELVDVLPTILEAAGISAPAEVQGESLLGLIKGSAASAREAGPVPPSHFTDRPAFAESDYPRRAYGWSPLQSLRTGKYLYIKAPRPELYDQSQDPEANHDLSSSSSAVASTLGAQLDAFRQKTSTTKDAPKVSLDPEAQEKLAALGYMATDPNAGKAGGKNAAADAKDKIEISNLMNQANVLREDGNCAEAVPILKKLITEEPEVTPLYVKLGQCLVLMKDYAQAKVVLGQILASKPDFVTSRFQLSMALIASGDVAGAMAQLQIITEKEPRWDRPHLMLATVLAQTERYREAVTECEKILETDPNNYAALLLEGQVLVLAEQGEAAVPRLQKAAGLQPRRPEPHSSLADAYSLLRNKAEAARERSAARRLGARDE